ncbi:MAG: HAMP domain-containing histidine kinase [Burkholderiaceae bacterium]|nr:HAMP domain-containing histidine kinase [Burkholderiaceae bacterium]
MLQSAPVPILTAIDVEVIVVAALAILFGAVWLRDRERGMAWLSFGFALMALWYFNSDRLVITGSTMSAALLRHWAIVIAAAVWAVNAGVIAYLGPPQGWMKWLVFACWLPTPLLMVALGLGVSLPVRLFHVGSLLCYLASAVLAFQRQRDEPGAGHLLLGLVLLSLPLTPFVMLALGIPAAQLRYVAAVPVALFGLILLTVSLLRRRRRLEAEVVRRAEAEEQLRKANAELESRVQQRTLYLQELVQGLEEFNRSVSHDLRGPLSGMASLARLAHEKLLQGDADLAKRALPAIAEQANASTQLVSTLLQLARLDDAKLQQERVDLEELVRSAFNEVTLALGAAAAPPALRLSRLPVVTADASLLRPALVNLLANAAKFSREAPAPAIEVDASVHGRSVTVSVRDNGVGFEPAVADRLFDPFYRGDAARFEGHGLGLHIVRRAIERHGGRVWAQSGGSGAAFCFTLPDAAPAPVATTNGRPAALVA